MKKLLEIFSIYVDISVYITIVFITKKISLSALEQEQPQLERPE